MDEPTGTGEPTHGPSADRVPGFAAAQSFTITEAAELTGISRTSIRRLLDAGELPGAFEAPVSGEGTRQIWRVPLADLLAAGLTITEPEPSEDRHTDGDDSAGPSGAADGPGVSPAVSPADSAALEGLRGRIEALERLVESERRRGDDMARMAEQAQRVAELALRRIGPGEQGEQAEQPAQGAPQAPTAPTAPPEAGEGSKPSQGFWGRLFGAGGG